MFNKLRFFHFFTVLVLIHCISAFKLKFSKSPKAFSYISSLQELEYITEKTKKHLFQGEVKTKNNRKIASGCHHISAINNGFARFRPGSVVINGSFSVYKVQIDVKDQKSNEWVQKTGNRGYSTFFPDEWTKEDVLKNIQNAYKNRIIVPGGHNEYRGKSINGFIEIRMYINDKGEIISAFPHDWTRKIKKFD